MAHATDIVGHVWRAETICTYCAQDEMAKELHWVGPQDYNFFHHRRFGGDENILSAYATAQGIEDYFDQYSYDSDHYPKVVFRDNLEPHDYEDDEGVPYVWCNGCGSTADEL